MRKLMTTLALLTLCSTAADAQTPNSRCAPFTTIESGLASGYGEKPHPIGLSDAGHLLYLFVNESTGTWTVVARLPNDIGCGVDAGEDFGQIPTPPEKPKQQGASFTPIHDWMEGQDKTYCCDDGDCHAFPHRTTEGELRYEVLIEGRWWPVPPEVIRDMPSPDGQVYVCCFPDGCAAKVRSLPPGNNSPHFRCAFVPGHGV